MSFFDLARIDDPVAARRAFLGKSGLILSGTAVALLAGRDVLAAKASGGSESDVRILNTALAAELEAIAAYQVGAESGLLQKPALDLAVTFQGHHKEHADVLKFAASLEKGAVSAYLGAVPVFGNRDLAKAAASILGDEAMHWAILRNAVGEAPVPSAFVA
ncbi:MAG TPA: ferritin-like domain-containing protein [Usitatibacter sp.]|nr:ferritin-like domain-containing protein [Usitatibacter sp.]